MNDFEAINNKVKLLYIKIEDAEFDKAYEVAENILLSNPENPDAYIAKLLCELKCHSLKELESVDVDFSSNPNFKRAMMYSSEETQKILSECLNKRIHKIQYRRIKIGIILAILLAIIVAIVILSFLGLFLFSNWFTNTRFNEAEALYEAGDYMTVYEMTQNNYLPPDSSRTKELASKCLSALCYSQFEEAFNQDDYTLAYERYFILKEAGFDCYEQEAQDIFNQLNDIAVNGEDLVDLRYGKKVLFGSINGELLAWDVVYVDRNTNRAVLIAREDISTYKRLTSNTCEFEYPEWYMGSNNEIETEGFYSNCFSSFIPNDEKYLIYNEETQSYFFEPSKTNIRKYITNMHYVFDIEPSEHSIWLCPEINEDTNDITYYYFDTESESVEEWSTSDQLNRGMRPMIWVNYTSTNN